MKDLIRDAASYGSRIPLVRGMLTRLYNARHRNHPWMRRHPFDLFYGTTTNGMLQPWLLRSGEAADAHITVYAGCQPSCVRQALTVIPQPQNYTFVDLGCGKGRALILASEFQFRKILGIELAPGLVTVARQNAQIIRKKFPKRTEIEVVKGDATAVPLPDGNLVLFLYHPFGPEILARMLSRITDAATTDRVIFLVYVNPVYGAMVDDIETFSRWYGENVPCAMSEIGFSPSTNNIETVVIWRIGGRAFPQWEGATRPIVITNPGWGAELGEHV